MAQIRIEQKLESRERLGLPYPTPIETAELLSSKIKDEISVLEAAKILGEAPHTIRRMADDGELAVRRTRKGHRRFSRKEIESILLRRNSGDATLTP